MPCDYSKYPADWFSRIRPEILQRAGYRCEGIPKYPNCRAEDRVFHPVTGKKVILTIAHINHDIKDNRPENLRALCQRCHLTWDAKKHAANRYRSRYEDRRSGNCFNPLTLTLIMYIHCLYI